VLITIQLDSETTSGVIIDQFPFGNPGAPTSGTYQDSASNDTGCSALGDLGDDVLGDPSHGALEDAIWAPFHSKRDWEIACWAKKHNLTSSAIAEFLAIPKVRRHCY